MEEILECVVCQQQVSHPTARDGKDAKVLEKHLRVVFVLRKVFLVPQEKVTQYLQGYPELSQWISFCEGCDTLIENCWTLWEETTRLQRQFHQYQRLIQELISNSEGFKEHDVHAEGNRSRKRNVIMSECRNFAVNHTYPYITNPFMEGDLVADRKFAAKQEAMDEEEFLILNEVMCNIFPTPDPGSDDDSSADAVSERTRTSPRRPNIACMEYEKESCTGSSEDDASKEKWNPSDSNDDLSEGPWKIRDIFPNSGSKKRENDEKIKDHLKQAIDQGRKPCLVLNCSESFKAWEKLSKHLTSSHTLKERKKGWKLECPKCKHLCILPKSYNAHCKRAHNATLSDIGMPRYVLGERKSKSVFEESCESNSETSLSLSVSKEDSPDKLLKAFRLKDPINLEPKRCLVPSCSKVFYAWRLLDRHVITCHTSGERRIGWRLECPKCHKLCLSYKPFRTHLRFKHQITQSEYIAPKYVFDDKAIKKEGKTKSSETSLKFCCPFCKSRRIPENTVRLCHHLRKCHKKSLHQQQQLPNLKCPICKSFECQATQISVFANHWIACKAGGKITLEEKVFFCELCAIDEDPNVSNTKMYFSYSNFLKHYLHHWQLRYECISCSEKLKNSSDANEHWDKKHETIIFSSEEGIRKIEYQSLPNIPWWCQECGQEFLSEDDRNHHVEQEHLDKLDKPMVDPLVCQFCDKRSRFPDDLKLHQETTHFVESGKLIACSSCKETQYFETQYQAIRHRRRFHMNEVIQCPTCTMEFFTFEQLSDHLAAEHQDQSSNLKCVTCGKIYPNQASLKAHVAYHGKKTSCEICNDEFRSLPALYQHMFREHQIEKRKRHPCPEPGCGKILGRKSRLRKHILRIHRKQHEKLHKCAYCEKAFAEIHNLRRHEMLHHQQENARGPQKYQCELCPHSTYYKGNLEIHRRLMHASEGGSEYRWQCEKCPYKTRWKQSLPVHTRKSHGPDALPRKQTKPYVWKPKVRLPPVPCPHCGVPFIRKLLPLHVRLRHSEIKEQRGRQETTVGNSEPSTSKCVKKTRMVRCLVLGCSQILPTVRDRDEHLKCSHSQEELKSTKCKTPMKKPVKQTHTGKLITAKQTKESQTTTIRNECETCKKMFRSRCQLVRHRKENMACLRLRMSEDDPPIPKPFLCETCGASFISKQRLTFHRLSSASCKKLRLPEEEATELCQICERRCANKFNLQKHIREVHEGKWRYYCEHCGKGVEGNRSLRDHMAKAHGIGEVDVIKKKVKEGKQCPQCGKTLANGYLLKCHLLAVHRTGEPTFKCDLCEKSFFAPNYLQMHKSVVHKGWRNKQKEDEGKESNAQ